MVTGEPADGSQSTRPVRCLSFHANYGCQNTGICCSSGWDIAVERPIELSLRTRLQASASGLPRDADGFRPLADSPAGCDSALRIDPETKSCWFRDEQDRACAIHRNFGEEALPSACRHFPRVCVLEPDLTSVSLSHYCPTAAQLLFTGDLEDSFQVVDAPLAFPSTWPFEGLDVRDTYSPFLRPGVLLGFDGLRALEKGAIPALSDGPDVWNAISRIEAAASDVYGWTPASGPVPGSIERAFNSRRASEGLPGTTWQDPRTVLIGALTSGSGSKGDLSLPNAAVRIRPWSPMVDRALRRYLAARLIGCWITFMAEDLSVTPRYLRLCLNTVLMFEADRPAVETELQRWKAAIRNADLWLMHHCDPELLAMNLR